MTEPAPAPPAEREPLPARRAPSGFVAVRVPEGVNGCPWLLVELNDDGRVELAVLADDEVAEWPLLELARCACNTTEQRSHVAGEQPFCSVHR